MIQALPAWRFKDIERLPMPVVELAAEAANERRDEDNKFYAMVHGVKWQEPKKAMSSSSVKAALANMPNGIKTFKRSELKLFDDG